MPVLRFVRPHRLVLRWQVLRSLQIPAFPRISVPPLLFVTSVTVWPPYRQIVGRDACSVEMVRRPPPALGRDSSLLLPNQRGRWHRQVLFGQLRRPRVQCRLRAPLVVPPPALPHRAPCFPLDFGASDAVGRFASQRWGTPDVRKGRLG